MARTPLAPAAQAMSGSSQRPAAGALSFLRSGTHAARWEPKRGQQQLAAIAEALARSAFYWAAVDVVDAGHDALLEFVF
jgi:hypothetical protein